MRPARPRRPGAGTSASAAAPCSSPSSALKPASRAASPSWDGEPRSSQRGDGRGRRRRRARPAARSVLAPAGASPGRRPRSASEDAGRERHARREGRSAERGDPPDHGGGGADGERAVGVIPNSNRRPCPAVVAQAAATKAAAKCGPTTATSHSARTDRPRPGRRRGRRRRVGRRGPAERTDEAGDRASPRSAALCRREEAGLLEVAAQTASPPWETPRLDLLRMPISTRFLRTRGAAPGRPERRAWAASTGEAGAAAAAPGDVRQRSGAAEQPPLSELGAEPAGASGGARSVSMPSATTRAPERSASALTAWMTGRLGRRAAWTSRMSSLITSGSRKRHQRERARVGPDVVDRDRAAEGAQVVRRGAAARRAARSARAR